MGPAVSAFPFGSRTEQAKAVQKMIVASQAQKVMCEVPASDVQTPSNARQVCRCKWVVSSMVAFAP